MSYQFLHTQNNKYPPEGPKTIPFPVEFVGPGEIQIDLLNQIQTGKISLVQGLFFNNTDGQDAEFVCAESFQVITIPAGAQGSFNVLSGQYPVFSVRSVGAGKLLLHLTNFPVTNFIWKE